MKLFGLLFRSITEETPIGGFGGTAAKFIANLCAIFLALPLNLLDALGMSHEEIHGFRRLRRATCGQCGGEYQQHHSVHDSSPFIGWLRRRRQCRCRLPNQ